MRAVAFVAASGTGKTTLLERLIPELRRRGLRVGALKHDAHRFQIDQPGKDSHRFTSAGAEVMVIADRETVALVRRLSWPMPVEEILDRYFADMDLVLVEGYGGGTLPRIELRRGGLGLKEKDRGAAPGTLLAVAADTPLDLDVPVLDLDDPPAVADFLVAALLG
jgi:molybdopterin-guanine dinucleotide biosynthesis protein B